MMNHHLNKIRTAAGPLLAALVLAGCATPPAEMPATPPPPAAFKHAAPLAGSTAQAQPAWWKVFGDPQLDTLVEQAGRANHSLQVAAARLAQARALLRRADAERLPQLNAAAAAGREQAPLAAGGSGRPQTLVGVGAQLSYEVDLAGRLARASGAAAFDALQREALLHNATLLVQAEVARSYFALRAVDAEIALVAGTVETYRGSLQLTERRYAAGDLPELDVARARSELAATQAEVLALQRQRTQLENALALLLGEAASAFVLPVQTTSVATAWPAALPQVPGGLPSSMLGRRPDVAAAQNALLAAQQRLGVAQTAWWPGLTLTAAGGQASPELSDLFKWSARSWAVNALLSLPLFDGGRRDAGVAQARAELDAAYAAWREQMLVALKDVEDELAALRLLDEQGQAHQRAVGAAERVTLLSGVRWRNGLVSQLELLDAQRTELRNRRQALQVRAAQVQSTVGLIRALGGGWS